MWATAIFHIGPSTSPPTTNTSERSAAVQTDASELNPPTLLVFGYVATLPVGLRQPRVVLRRTGRVCLHTFRSEFFAACDSVAVIGVIERKCPQDVTCQFVTNAPRFRVLQVMELKFCWMDDATPRVVICRVNYLERSTTAKQRVKGNCSTLSDGVLFLYARVAHSPRSIVNGTITVPAGPLLAALRR